MTGCVACNGSFRFAELLAFAERAGASRLATGHYARVVRHRGRLLLARAADPRTLRFELPRGSYDALFLSTGQASGPNPWYLLLALG